MASPIKVFYSYAHLDETLRNELDRHLKILVRAGVIEPWHDRQIGAGEEWKNAIDEHLESARIILLLVSSDFIASDYCYDIEMKRALERHASQADPALVIPIILRPCRWQSAPFGKLQALPKDAKPVTSWANRDEAWLDVEEGMRRAIEQLQAKQQPPASAPAAAPEAATQTTPSAQTEPSAAQTEPSAAQTVVTALPALLPHLCDRGKQEAALVQALKQHRQSQSRRPVVCLLHGHRFESHVEFLERMYKGPLKKLLTRTSKAAGPREIPLRAAHTAFESPAGFWWELAVALEVSDADQEPQQAVYELLKQSEDPLIVTLDLSTKLFKQPGADLLPAFLQFCAAWEDLPLNRVVLLCLCFRFEEQPQPRWFDFKLKQRQAWEQQLQVLLRELEQDFSAYPQCCGVALPELPALTQDDVRAWYRIHQIGERFRISKQWIDDLFSEAEQISMRAFEMKLEALLEQRSS
ncbi:MAG: TIR domain-containing protein [Acidobacteria bacterium]|nr:TIR domain-containing protein [Acidobacteriota bacterium]MBI3425138.1 TIR domain-containing protein [Acidobacteriota bacterium]